MTSIDWPLAAVLIASLALVWRVCTSKDKFPKKSSKAPAEEKPHYPAPGVPEYVVSIKPGSFCIDDGKVFLLAKRISRHTWLYRNGKYESIMSIDCLLNKLSGTAAGECLRDEIIKVL